MSKYNTFLNQLRQSILSFVFNSNFETAKVLSRGIVEYELSVG